MADANFGGRDAEQTRSALIGSLRASCGIPTLASVVSFVESAEEVLKSFVAAHIRIYLADISPVRLVPSGSNGLTGNQGEQYLVLGSEEPRNHQDFYITVLALSPAHPSNLKEKSARINPPSRFRAVKVLVPEAFESVEENLLERAKFVLDVGYAWMVESIVRMVDGDEMKVAEGLYDLCRDIFPEQELREQIWFATVGPVYGFRFITPEVLRAALKMDHVADPRDPSRSY